MSKTTTLPAGLFVPDFLLLDNQELNVLFNVLRNTLTTHVHVLLVMHSNFATGEFLGGYHRLMELCRPPQPERGKRLPGPSLQQVRRAIQDLINQGIVMRNAALNAAQGQLRLFLKPREQKSTSGELHNRKYNRDAKGPKPVSMRVSKGSKEKTEQDMQQGYQEGINTPISPQKPSYPQAATPQQKKPAPAAVQAYKASLDKIYKIADDKTINRPPRGVKNGPHGGSQVAAARLMAGNAGD